MLPRSLAVVLAIFTLAPAACRPKDTSRGVLEALDAMVRLAESRELEAFMAAVDDGYSDFEGRDKAGLRNLLAGYFSGRTGIVVHRLGSQLEFPEAERAELETDLALSSGAAEALRRLVKISPDLYRLRVGLVRPAGRWLVRYAEWRPVALGEVLPESLGPLKVLLPNPISE